MGYQTDYDYCAEEGARKKRCEHYYGNCPCADSDDYRACRSGTCFDDHDEEPILECKVHRRYQAKRKPRVACEACWRKYIALHPA